MFRNASQVLQNPDFGALLSVKTHIISGIRHQCCRTARSHTRSRAGKGKPDASFAPTPGFLLFPWQGATIRHSRTGKSKAM